MNIIKFFFYFFFITFTSNLYAETKPIPNNQSMVIFHNNFFGDGLPNRIEVDEKKIERWGWGNWSSNMGYGNFTFTQTGPGRILTQSGMRSKDVMKSWGVKNYNLKKKSGFKSSGNRAFAQLVEIDNQSCVVIISSFSQSGSDALNRNRSVVEGYICNYTNKITIEDGKNFMHCLELKGQNNHYIGKNMDNQCIKKIDIKNETKKSTNDNNEGSLEDRLKKLKSLFDKKLISKEEYDQKRKEILDEM